MQQATASSQTAAKPQELVLRFGYSTKDDAQQPVTHKKVVFGRRPTGSDLIAISESPESGLETQLELLLARCAIIQFGTIEPPIPLSVLLTLNQIDRADLLNANLAFLGDSLGERTTNILSANKVQLAFGFEKDGVTYDIAEFGHLLTGYEEAEFDRAGATGWRRLCFKLGRQITRLSQSKGSATLDGPVPLERFEPLDMFDVTALSEGAEAWLDSFRNPGEEVA